MKKYVPDYYNDFRCLAGRCRHNCCIGWEIDIDRETLAFYDTVGGEMGQKLAANICREGDTAHFCLKENGRCPFLNENDLCEIVMELGFEKTSQICDDHPRFRNFFSEREETGLGMSCEAVAQLILTRTDKTQLVCAEDGEELLWPDECDFLDIRDDIFYALQNREKTVDSRIEDMLAVCGINMPSFTAAGLADIFLPLERLDEQWTALVESLKNIPEESLSFTDNSFDIPFEQLLVYLVFRHTADSLDDGLFAGRVLMVTAGFYLIRYLLASHRQQYGTADMNTLCEISRMFSAEIEYSTENTEILAELFENL